MEHVKEVLLRLRYAGIQLRSEKCRFGYTEIDFGAPYHFRRKMPTKTSTELLLKFPRPNSLRELQTSNRVPDYLSRVPDLEVNPELNEECVFEDKISQAGMAGQMGMRQFGSNELQRNSSKIPLLEKRKTN